MTISGEMPAFKLTRLLSARRVTPRISAPLVTVRPSGSRQSWRTSRVCDKFVGEKN